MEKKIQFEQLLKLSKQDDNIIGFFLGGSRGKGFHDDKSDYDIYIIVTDDSAEKYKQKYPKHKYDGIDLMIYSEKEFKNHALWNSDTQVNRYNFAYTKVIVDKNDSIQKMLDEKGRIPDSEVKNYVSKQIDSYLNHFIRSIRCYERGDKIGYRLSTGYFIYHAIAAILGLEGRICPYSDYLTRELEIRPAKYLSFSTSELFKLIEDIFNCSIEKEQQFATDLEKIFRNNGFGEIIDDWNNNDKWAIKYKKDL